MTGVKLEKISDIEVYLFIEKGCQLIFLKSIGTCLKFYKVVPHHYFSFCGLSWDGTLKMTGVKLEKIFDIALFLFIEKALRGGVSHIAKRYSKANNKQMKSYVPNLS